MVKGDLLNMSLDDIVARTRSVRLRENGKQDRPRGGGPKSMAGRDKGIRGGAAEGSGRRRVGQQGGWRREELMEAGVGRGRGGRMLSRGGRNGNAAGGKGRGVGDGPWLHDMFNGQDEEMADGPMFQDQTNSRQHFQDAAGAARLLRSSAISSVGGGGGMSAGGMRTERSGLFAYDEVPPRLAGGRVSRAVAAFRAGDESGGAIVKVGKLDYSVMEEDLRELFKNFGAVERVWIEYDRFDRSTGVGGCIFRRQSDALKAVKQLDGRRVAGQNIELVIVDNMREEMGGRSRRIT
eukprot:GHVS01010556.1.p1 GENE.GHVS01010556.1~~GHVS01010556.1.p1  ORF type:complete len:293 (-),score=63.82 GHVS01010556.1:152-1030(-)